MGREIKRPGWQRTKKRRPLKWLALGWIWLGTPGAEAVEEITLSTADGITLSGSYYPSSEKKAAGVILWHDLDRDRSDWEGLAEKLQEEDYAVLAMDLRGHGKSTRRGQETMDRKTMSEADFGNAVQDVQTAYQYLTGREDIDKERIAMVGAGWGANLALSFAARKRELKSLVLLSPALSIKGLKALEDMDRYGERPAFLIASLKDSEAAEAVRQLEKAARGQRMVKVYEDAGRGAEMLKKAKDLPDLIADWLDDTL